MIKLNRNSYKQGEIVTITSLDNITFNHNTQVVRSGDYEIDTSLLQDEVANLITDDQDVPIVLVDYSKFDSVNLTDEYANIITDDEGNPVILVDYFYFNVISEDKIDLIFQDETHLGFLIDDTFDAGTYECYVVNDDFSVFHFTLVVYVPEAPKDPHTKPKQTLKYSPNYIQTTKLYIQALTHMFDDLWWRYQDNDGNYYEVDVPVLMAHASKSWRTRKAIDDELEKDQRFAKYTNYKTPCVTVGYITKNSAHNRDVVNKFGMTTFRNTDGSVLFQNRFPRPFDYKFKVEIWTYSHNHLEYIHEQLLPYIDEGFSITINEFYNNQQFKRQVNVLLDSINDWDYADTYSADDNKENHLVTTLNFTFEGYQYFPVNTDNVEDIIQKITMSIGTGYMARTYNNDLHVPEYEVQWSDTCDTIDIEHRPDIADDEQAQNNLIYQDGAIVYEYTDEWDSFKNVVVSDINYQSSDCCGNVGTKTVDETDIGDGKIISYSEESDSMVYIDNEGNVQEYQTQIDDIDVHSFYIGNAELDVGITSSGWRIRKSVEENGAIVYYYPNGSSEFNFVWEQRDNYQYSLPI